MIVVHVWSYAKLAGAATLVGAAAKAGADAWDRLKAGRPALLGRLTHRVDVRVALDDDATHDMCFKIDESAASTLEVAVEAIAEHAQRIERGDSPTWLYLRWNADKETFEE